MCGIVGLLDPRRGRPEAESQRIVEAMAGRMVPRGPDGSGSWVDPDAGVALGHRRLSILDLSPAGAQPMVSADGRWVITFNGEVYDHAELAADLDAVGVRRRGHSDTEILLEAVARWGLRDVLERVDGMWAFGLWDRRERSLTLVRDRMGEKPLSYGHLGSGEFVFASTLDVLRAHPDWDRPVDRDALALFFRFKYVPAPWSIFSGVHKLEPGCTVTVGADGAVGPVERYWDYLDLVGRTTPFDGSPEDAVDELDRLLRRSVRRRMVADVPVGAFLSGGIDSSTVVAVAQQESAVPLRTFTIGSTSADFDESSDARRVAEHLGADHTELVVTEADSLAVVDRLGAMYDEPFADSSQIPTFLVSELARRQVTVALSGDGGDELFAGYNRHVWAPAIWRRLERVPRPVRSAGAAVLERVPPGWWDGAARLLPASRRPRQLGLKVAKVLGVADASDQTDVVRRLVSHWQDPASLVAGAAEPATLLSGAAGWPAGLDPVGSIAAVDAVTYLPDDILTKVDRATMAVSLEGRIPLLDRSILELAISMPTSLKVRDGRSKWPLRQVLGRYVPTELVDRPKSGFGLPIEEWLVGPLRPWAEEHLFSPVVRDTLDVSAVQRAWNDHTSGRRNEAYSLWDVVLFSAWCEERGIDP